MTLGVFFILGTERLHRFRLERTLCSRRRPNWFASAQLNLGYRGAKIRWVPQPDAGCLYIHTKPVTNLTAIRRAREMIAFVEDRESSVTAPYDAIAAEAHSTNRNCNMVCRRRSWA